jgi:general secretion pathway protein I
MTKPRLKPKVQGFTLIEVLTAMMILSISLVVIFQLFSAGLNADTRAEGYTRAVFHAREKMEELLLIPQMTGGNLEGDFGDGFRWQAEISLLETIGDEKQTSPQGLFRIWVEINWQGGEQQRRIDISTIHLASLPAPG